MKQIFKDKLKELVDLIRKENLNDDDTVLIVVGEDYGDGTKCQVAFAGKTENHTDLLINLFEDKEDHGKVVSKLVFDAVNQYREEHKTCLHPHPDENPRKMLDRVMKTKNDQEKPKKGESLPDFIARVYKDKPEAEKKFAMKMAELVNQFIKS